MSDNILREAKLVCVAVDHRGASNSNKFYNLKENADGSLTAEYGRVGARVNTVNYPAGKKNFDKVLISKRKKGYTDITSLKQTTNSSDNGGDIFKGVDSKVKTLLTFLMDCSRNKVSNNYLVTTDDVTRAQIDKAQELIDNAIKYITKGGTPSHLNQVLMELYAVLPRKMKNVKDHLADSLASDRDVEAVRKLMDSEQSLLSTLESQLLTNAQTTDSVADDKNILDEMGISVEIETDKKMLDKINFFLGQNKQYAKNIFKVTNHATQKRFDDHVAKAKNKETALLWHGSRNENIMGIFQQGLMIRPANAVITGAMFGNGIYFANRSQKSLGYSSLRGSYWTGGNETKGFLFLFSVHTGEQKQVQRHSSSCYKLHEEYKKSTWDSVFAHKGIDLRNDEIITYDTDKQTISYLIEMEK